MVVKRSPLSVGDRLTVNDIKAHAGKRYEHLIPAGTGGFTVKEVIKHNHASGGYMLMAESVRNIDGAKIECVWFITHPSFGLKNPKPFSSSFRIVANVNDNDYKATQKPVSMQTTMIVEKSVVAGSRPKRMVLADFLEE